MAFSATALAAEPRSFSIGPLKIQLFNYSCLSSDTSGSVVADRLSTIFQVLADGQLAQTAAQSFAGNVATLSFAVPGVQRYTCTVGASTATIGSLYYDAAGNEFSVGATIAAATSVVLVGSVAPSGTLTKASGMPAGDSATMAVSAAVGPTVRGTLMVIGV